MEEKLCMRCGAVLKEVPKDDWIYPSFDEEGYEGSVAEYECPECLTYYSVSAPQEEERENYPAYNKELEEHFIDAHHGYDGFCPQCGSHIVWSGDFMRSEVFGDVDETDLDEYGCPKDDALASYVSCPYCGCYIEVVEAKPSMLKAREEKENV